MSLPLVSRSARAETASWQHRFSSPMMGALITLIVLVVANAIFTPNFATTDNLWNMLWQVSGVILVGVGMTFVIATAGIDLSVGSVMAIASAIAAVQLDRGIGLALLLGLGGACLVGLLNGVLVARDGNQPIVVTLASLIAGRGIAQVLSHDGQLVSIDNASFAALGQGRIGPVPVPVVIAIVVVAVSIVVLRATPFGRYVLAVGGNRSAARLAGIPVQRTIITVYVMSALLAGLAGLLEAARVNASDAAKIGLNVELDAIAAAVVGGTLLTGGRASITGTVLGALVMQVVATSFNMRLVPYAWSLVLKAIIIVVAVYLQRTRRA